MHRREVDGLGCRRTARRRCRAGVARDELQRARHGAGPLFHRRYRARIRDTRMSPEELMAPRQRATSTASRPSEFASFQKVRGERGRAWRVGDEFVVRMPGPWDGPVRVVEVHADRRSASPRSPGHLEAGPDRVPRAHATATGCVFDIESWARSGDRLSDLLYHRLRMAKEIQLHMWTSFLERVARARGGRITGGIEHRHAPGGGCAIRVSVRYRRAAARRLAELRAAAELRPRARSGSDARARLARRRPAPGRCPASRPGRRVRAGAGRSPAA